MSYSPPVLLKRRNVIATLLAAPAIIKGLNSQALAHNHEGGVSLPDLGPQPAPIKGKPRKLTIAWNLGSICTAAVPVAREKGFFKRYNLDVSYVDFAGSTDQLLEALSSGKADGAPGMALRWLKPMQQGFDVKLTAGLHAGCLHLMVPEKSEVKTLAALRGKTIGVADIGGPAKNFFGIRLKEIGINPESDVQWRQYPADLLPLALKRGAVQAIAGDDPLIYQQKKQFHLAEVDSNMNDAWAHVPCCVVGLRGSLIRNEPDVALAVTYAILEAGRWLADNPEETGRIFEPYAPKTQAADLTAMLRTHGHKQQFVNAALSQQVAFYAEELKKINVFPQSLDSQRYAKKVTQDIFPS